MDAAGARFGLRTRIRRDVVDTIRGNCAAGKDHCLRALAGRAARSADRGSYASLWQWSVASPAEFWASIWDYFEVLGSRGTGPVLTGEQMPAIGWFSGSTLNYARNVLRTAETDGERTALIYRSEAGHRAASATPNLTPRSRPCAPR